MIHLFKTIKVIYASLSALGIAAFLHLVWKVLMNWQNNTSSGFVMFYFIILIFYLLILHKLFCKIASIRYIHIYKNFFEKCDPLKYIETVQKEIDLNGNRSINITIKLDICVAYMELNRMDEAKEILDGIFEFPDNDYGLINRKLYYSSLLIYNISIHNIAKAEAVFNEMMDFIKNSNLYKHHLIDYDSVYKTYFNKLELLKGHYDGMEQYYMSQLKANDFMLNKVNTKSTLGKIYMHYNKTEEAKEAFEYVVQHGNKLYAVQKAKQYLEQFS